MNGRGCGSYGRHMRAAPRPVEAHSRWRLVARLRPALSNRRGCGGCGCVAPWPLEAHGQRRPSPCQSCRGWLPWSQAATWTLLDKRCEARQAIQHAFLQKDHQQIFSSFVNILLGSLPIQIWAGDHTSNRKHDISVCNLFNLLHPTLCTSTRYFSIGFDSCLTKFSGFLKNCHGSPVIVQQNSGDIFLSNKHYVQLNSNIAS